MDAKVVNDESRSPGGKRLCREFGADDQVRTGDLNLGKVALYQLSYIRVCWLLSHALLLKRCKYTYTKICPASYAAGFLQLVVKGGEEVAPQPVTDGFGSDEGLRLTVDDGVLIQQVPTGNPKIMAGLFERPQLDAGL